MSDGTLSAAEEKELRQLARRKLEKIEKPSPPFFRWTPTRVAAAAIALIVVVMAVFWITKVDRGTVYREIKGQDELTLIEPSGKLPSPPLVFEWTPYESAEDYTFEIIDEELNTIFFKTNLLDSHYSLPEAVAEKMKKGVTYLWKVFALDDDANVLASGTAYIEIE